MRKLNYVGPWVATLAAILTALVALLSLSGPASTQEACPPSYATDHIVVGMAPGASVESLEGMKSLNGEGGDRNYSANAWAVDLPAGRGVADAIALYSVAPGVEYAQTDEVATLDEACTGGGPDLAFRSADGPDPVAVGEDLTYAVAVVNTGHAAAAKTHFFTAVPDDARFVSSGFVNGGTKGDCPPEPSGAIRCDLGRLGGGVSAVFEFVVRPTRPGNLSTIVHPTPVNGDIALEWTINTTVKVPDHCTIADTDPGVMLTGTPGRDVICGFDGEDVVSAGGGDDIVYGGVGDDTIFGGAGSDRLGGGEGNDALRSRDGMRRDVDRVRGGAGEDNILADSWDRVRAD